MKNLNLDPMFAPFGQGLSIEGFDFPSGCEPHVKLLKVPSDEVRVTARIHTMNDLFRLAMAAEVLDHRDVEWKELFLPFVPCARQDRRMMEGEPLSAKIVANFINSMKFDRVIIFDPHSDVIVNLIDKCRPITNHAFVETCLNHFYEGFPQDMNTVSIVAPDAGSNKKSKDLLSSLNQHLSGADVYPLIKCDKTRDVISGEITGFEISSGEVSGRVCMIVDDICDGGGTFTGLAKQLHKAGAKKVILVASHGIFSKTLSLAGVDQIYTTNSVKDFTALPKSFTQFELCRDILI